MKRIVPIKKSELDEVPHDVADLYITDLKHPDEYLELPLFPKIHIWCRFNSFNIPPTIDITSKDSIKGLYGRDPVHIHLVMFQGAGDILHLHPFMNLLKDTYQNTHFLHYTYRQFMELSPSHTYALTSGIYPNDLTYHQFKGRYSQGVRQISFHHPPVAGKLRQDCQKCGWDKFDWFSLVSGVRIDSKTFNLTPEKPDLELPDGTLVGLHYLASSMNRTWYEALELVSYFNLVYPNIKFVLLGGEAEQQLGDLPNLLNLAGKLSYKESAWVIKELDALVCVDSIVLHLAKLCKTPTLALFGWSPASWSGPYPNNINFLEAGDMSFIRKERVIEWLKINLDLV